MNAGLILAGGKGERLIGSHIPKQFIEVCGKTIIQYCLDIFDKSPDIDVICVVANEAWRSEFSDYKFANAGISRQHSIYNGLLALKPYAPAYVIIHDSVRPLVTLDDISGLLKAATGFGGAMPSLPVTETVYRSCNSKSIDGTLNRDELFIGQTPECYDFSRYLSANEQFVDTLGKIRGSSEIAVNAGMKIALAKGNPENFKITTIADFERFRNIMEKRQAL